MGTQNVIKETEALFKDLAKGHTQVGSIVMSQYMQLKKLDQQLENIKRFCGKPRGLIRKAGHDLLQHTPLAGPTKEDSEALAKHVNAIQIALRGTTDGIFCPRFEQSLKRLLGDIMKVVERLESRISKKKKNSRAGDGIPVVRCQIGWSTA